MRRPIIAPDLGDAEPMLNFWLAGLGEHLYAGDRVVELLVNCATFDVSSPATGKLVERLIRPGETVHPGAILGHIEEDEEPPP